MTMPEPIKALLRSRKVLLAALGAAQTIVLAYFNVDPKVWLSINALLLVVINAIAVEDAADKSGNSQAIAGGTVNVTNTPATTDAPKP